MNLEQIHRVYFIGIGGIGMSALARYFKFVGKHVAGYDKTPSPITAGLVDLGISIVYDDGVENLPEPFKGKEGTLVVYTPAVPKAHRAYQYFDQEGFEVMKRAAVLGIITKDTYCFAVAGTHGKTTVSCILAHLLAAVDAEFTAFLGGVSEDFGSNFVLKGTAVSVVEADEFDRSFLHLYPNMACITTMDADHLDVYGTKEGLTEAFAQFAARVAPDGGCVVAQGLPIGGVSYGIDDDSPYRISDVEVVQGAYRFTLTTPGASFRELRFHKPGRHNLNNALAAFAMAAEAGYPQEVLAKALGSFKGVARRFSYRKVNASFVFIDDYAHHPTEIDAVFQALAEMHPGKKTLAIFQPHLYSRTRDFGPAFAKSLSRFGHTRLLEVYPAREDPFLG